MKNYSNILLIKPGAVGDLLQLTPVIRALALKYPGARITLMLGSSASASLFLFNPDIYKTIVFDRKGAHRSLAAFLKLWRQILAARYDLVVNFQRSNIKAWVLAFAAFPCRCLVYHKARGRIVHAVVNHLETLAPLGIDPSTADLSLNLVFGAEDKLFAERILTEAGFNGKTLVALNPGASHPVNRWSTKSFAALADRISQELNAGIVLIGGESDKSLSESILSQTKSTLLTMTGKTSLLQLGALLDRCSLLISGDTGPMHLATAVGTKVLALFGAADPERTGPVGSGHRVLCADTVRCVPCCSRRCANEVYLECMEEISVEKVFLEVQQMLKEPGRLP
ncbi:MAG: glycosyltransferase family 9 protein [Geobacter sp.]|nr:MAG: glycosyltransferase family 9 protein [Geobacter sp.]